MTANIDVEIFPGAIVRYHGSNVDDHGIYLVEKVDTRGRYTISHVFSPSLLIKNVRRISVTPSAWRET